MAKRGGRTLDYPPKVGKCLEESRHGGSRSHALNKKKPPPSQVAASI
jgi:hypothetical protein